MFRRLRVRLLLSYLLVVLVGAAAFLVTFLLLAPTLFDHNMGAMHSAAGMSASRASSRQAFSDALVVALPVAVAVSVVVAALVAAFVTRRILRPIEAVRRATARMGAGHYDERVEPPSEPELAALADDVNRLAAAMEETEARRARLIGEVAHEMRTPLTVIDGYVEGIVDGVFPADPTTLDAIGAETRRLARLAADLAALSRAEEGAVDLALVPTDLADLAGVVVRRLQPQFDDKGVGIVLDTGPAPVAADETRTEQILTNLVGNALTYTPPGGTVTVRTSSVAATARVEIVDTGLGMSAETAQQVFERFYRVPGVERPMGGSGIGLTIARGLARLQGGDVTASSAGEGQGSTFVLELPRRT